MDVYHILPDDVNVAIYKMAGTASEATAYLDDAIVLSKIVACMVQCRLVTTSILAKPSITELATTIKSEAQPHSRSRNVSNASKSGMLQ